MNILFKYIFTNIKEHKFRSMVMLLSILLSATLLFVSFSIGVSYEAAQRKMARGMVGEASVKIRANDTFIDIEDIPDHALIQDKVQLLKGEALYHKEGYYETVDLIAANLDDLNKINPMRLSGDTELNQFLGNQIILPDRFTTQYGIEKGDEVTLQIGKQNKAFTVFDIAAYDTLFLRQSRGVTVVMPYTALEEVFQEANGSSEVLLTLTDKHSISNVISDLSEQLPKEQYQIEKTVNEAQINADAKQKSMPFFLISFFSLTMSIFIIYSSYKVITLDRLPIIGTFRSIGATAKTVTRLLLLESLVYGTIGGLIGIPVGILLLKWILNGLGSSISKGIEIPVVISNFGMAAAIVVAVFVSLLSAYLPIRKASQLPIKDIILGNIEDRKNYRPRIILLGIIMVISAIFLPYIVPDQFLYLAGGLSLIGFIAGTIMVLPNIINLFSIGMEYLYMLLFKNEGKLAARNLRDNKSIVQNITLLFISISAVIVISVIGNFVTDYITGVFEGSQLQGFAEGKMDITFVDDVRKMEGIEKVLPVYVYENEILGNEKFISRIEATEHLDQYSDLLGLTYVSSKTPQEIYTEFTNERYVLVSSDYLKQTKLKVGDELILSNQNEKYRYQIIGTYQSRATKAQAIISSDNAEADFYKSHYSFLAYTAENADAVMIQIRDRFGNTTNWSRTVEEFNQDAVATVSGFLQPMQSMTYFILILSAIGIINNLMINYIQKRRIMAVYKSIGLSHRQNLKMVFIEGFSSGAIGALIAICVSYMEIQTIFLIVGQKITMTPQLDETVFLLAGAMGIFITLLGSIIPIIKSYQMKLVEEIKFE